MSRNTASDDSDETQKPPETLFRKDEKLQMQSFFFPDNQMNSADQVWRIQSCRFRLLTNDVLINSIYGAITMGLN